MTSNHTPAAPPRSLLGLWAHPDDESYLSAGLMDRVLRAGGRVTVVILTDGEAGFAADDPRPVEERRALRRVFVRRSNATTVSTRSWPTRSSAGSSRMSTSSCVAIAA